MLINISWIHNDHCRHGRDKAVSYSYLPAMAQRLSRSIDARQYQPSNTWILRIFTAVFFLIALSVWASLSDIRHDGGIQHEFEHGIGIARRSNPQDVSMLQKEQSVWFLRKHIHLVKITMLIGISASLFAAPVISAHLSRPIAATRNRVYCLISPSITAI